MKILFDENVQRQIEFLSGSMTLTGVARLADVSLECLHAALSFVETNR